MLVFFAHTKATAQDAVERSALARCAVLADADEKLACFEALAAGEGRGEPALPQASQAEDAPPPAALPPPAPAETRPPRATDDLGAEFLDDEEDDRIETVNATVEEVWKGGNRLLYFRFSNGQVWRQMESGYFYYPRDGDFEVTIRQGFMGDYQMRLEGSGRMTRIVRVQ